MLYTYLRYVTSPPGTAVLTRCFNSNLLGERLVDNILSLEDLEANPTMESFISQLSFESLDGMQPRPHFSIFLVGHSNAIEKGFVPYSSALAAKEIEVCMCNQVGRPPHVIFF